MAASQHAFRGWLDSFERLVLARVQRIGLHGFLDEFKCALENVPWRRTSHRYSVHCILHLLLGWYHSKGLLRMEPPPLFPQTDIGCLVYRQDLTFLPGHGRNGTIMCLLFVDKLYNMCRLNAGKELLSLKAFLMMNGMQEQVEDEWPRDLETACDATQLSMLAGEKRKREDLDYGATTKKVCARTRGSLVKLEAQCPHDVIAELRERVQVLSDREKQLTQFSAHWVDEREQVKQENAVLEEEHEAYENRLRELENENNTLKGKVLSLKMKYREGRQNLIGQLQEEIKNKDITKNPKYQALENESNRFKNAGALLYNALCDTQEKMADIFNALDGTTREVDDFTHAGAT